MYLQFLIVLSFIFAFLLYIKRDWLLLLFEKGIVVGILIIIFIIGLFRGVNVNSLDINLYWFTLELSWINAVSTSILFTIGVLFTGILLYTEISKDKSYPTLSSGDEITAIIPVYKDGSVLHRSVNSLLESTYDPVQIAIGYEPDDTDSLQKATELAQQSETIQLIENQYPGSKAGAIQTIVEQTESDYFVVFDADEIIKPDFIPTAMHEMVKNDFDIFQGRRIPEPTGLIESLAYCERITYHASYKLVELTGFKNCRSSSTAFTREAFETVNGYDDLLTEDLAFAHKAYRHDLSINQSRNYTSLMEAPHTFWDFWGQRKRWRMGQVEVLHKSLSGTLTTDGIWYRRYISISRMMLSMLGSIILLSVLSKLLVLILLGTTLFYIVPLIAISLVSTACGYKDKQHGDIDSIRFISVVSFFVYPLFSLLMVKSLLEYLLTWDGSWYHVEKTDK